MNRRIITIDIETLPAPEVVAHTASTMQKSDSKDLSKTALNGDCGRILCIGYYNERLDKSISGVLGWCDSAKKFSNDERVTLIEFWELLRGFNTRIDCIVGHNIFDFDLKFIYKRSIIHGVKPTVDFSFARYRSQPVFDTMHEWEKWSYGTCVKMDYLARVLSLPSSKESGIDGSCVASLYALGRHQEIHDYCLRDVVVTRAIYRKMVFADASSDVPVSESQKQTARTVKNVSPATT